MKQRLMLSVDNLYHYTKFETAIRILSSGQLFLSSYSNCNDINENCGPTVISTGEDSQEIWNILKYYVQVSFSMDAHCDNMTKRGYNIPMMWGHYAENGKGVCIAFDKQEVLDAITEDDRLYSRKVEYSNIWDWSAINYDKKLHGDALNFICRAKDCIFFHKTKDWEYENEYRIIAFNDCEQRMTLDIGNCLSGIILFSRNHENFINSSEVKALSKIVGLEKIYRYVSWGDSYGLYDYQGNLIEPKELKYDLSKTLNCQL